MGKSQRKAKPKPKAETFKSEKKSQGKVSFPFIRVMAGKEMLETGQPLGWLFLVQVHCFEPVSTNRRLLASPLCLLCKSATDRERHNHYIPPSL